ncbi:hypothetical protein ACFE04_024347 [Oxalis oulophora]
MTTPPWLRFRPSFFGSSFSQIRFRCFLFIYQSKAKTARSLFIFGDSLADVGNNNYLPFSVLKANFAHNGIDFPTKKATGRFSNGKNTADFIAERMGLASPPAYRSLDLTNQNDSSYLKGVNFASGGAGIMDELIQEIKEWFDIKARDTQSLSATTRVMSSSTIHFLSFSSSGRVSNRHQSCHHVACTVVDLKPRALHDRVWWRSIGVTSVGRQLI